MEDEHKMPAVIVGVDIDSECCDLNSALLGQMLTAERFIMGRGGIPYFLLPMSSVFGDWNKNKDIKQAKSLVLTAYFYQIYRMGAAEADAVSTELWVFSWSKEACARLGRTFPVMPLPLDTPVYVTNDLWNLCRLAEAHGMQVKFFAWDAVNRELDELKEAFDD